MHNLALKSGDEENTTPTPTTTNLAQLAHNEATFCQEAPKRRDLVRPFPSFVIGSSEIILARVARSIGGVQCFYPYDARELNEVYAILQTESVSIMFVKTTD